MSKIPQNICRICEQINELTNILQFEYQWLIDKYISCANVTFDINDELPKYFCKNCIENLQSAHKFKEKCEFTHNKFMELIQNSYESESEIQNHTNVIIKSEWEDNQMIENENDQTDMQTKEKLINVKIEQVLNNKDNPNRIPLKRIKAKKLEVLNSNNDNKIILPLKQKRSHECYMCPTMKFHQKLSLLRHMRNQHKFLIEIDLKQTCNLCNKTYHDHSSLMRHKKAVHLGIKIKPKITETPCEHCNKLFTTAQSKIRHVRTVHLGEKMFSCTICGKSFGQLSILKSHQSNVHLHEKRFKCEHCPKEFTTKLSLLNHSLQHLPNDDEQRLTILRKQKQRKEKLQSKIEFNNRKRIVCEICGKSITVSGVLGHRLMHEGLKPHKCTICSNLFRTKHDLKKHSQKHTNISPYKCDICEKTFRRKGSLSAHLLRHSGEKPHKCLVCNKQFLFSFNLRLHSRIHSGEKPFCCKLCSKNFSNNGALRKHETLQHDNHQSYKEEEAL